MLDKAVTLVRHSGWLYSVISGCCRLILIYTCSLRRYLHFETRNSDR